MAEKAKIIPSLFIEIVHVPTHFAKFLRKYPNSEKEKNFLCCLYMFFIKRKNELGIFTAKSCSGCKEMYKDCDALAELSFCLLLFKFLWPTPALDLTVPNAIQGHIGHIIRRWASSYFTTLYCWCFTESVHK